MQFNTAEVRAAIFSSAILISTSGLLANHGPGTSGGGSSTISGETLRPGVFDLSLRQDYTQFQKISQEGAERRALAAGGFDALRSAFITTASLSYGITEDLQASASVGYYWGNNFIDAESEDGASAESSTVDPEGFTDLSLQFKYRVYHGKEGHLSLIGGVIAPTGRDGVVLASGELLEPSSQPGNGEWAAQAGLGYSRFLTPSVTTDLSALYTYRFQDDGFKVGDRLDLGAVVAYRITDSVKDFPNFSVFGEVNAVWLGKDEADDEVNENSGGWTVYLTPGGRVRFNDRVSLTVAPSFPILQEQNGEQIESRFKLAMTLSISF